jgi:hypothetical protein
MHGMQSCAEDDAGGDSDPAGHARHVALLPAPRLVLYVLAGHAVHVSAAVAPTAVL